MSCFSCQVFLFLSKLHARPTQNEYIIYFSLLFLEDEADLILALVVSGVN